MCKDEDLSDLIGVFITHRSQLCHVAIKILGSRERAEDVVHDAYLKIRDVSSVFVVNQPLAYVSRVVRNLAIDHYRRSVLEAGVFAEEEEGMDIPSVSGTPEAVVIGREQLSLVARALEQLPERTQKAFDLYRLEGHTQRDIALILDVSPTLVNFMIRDALVHCRNALNSSLLLKS